LNSFKKAFVSKSSYQVLIEMPLVERFGIEIWNFLIRAFAEVAQGLVELKQVQLLAGNDFLLKAKHTQNKHSTCSFIANMTHCRTGPREEL